VNINKLKTIKLKGDVLKMNNVIEFKSRKVDLGVEKEKRFIQLKVKYFNQTMTPQEEIEFNEVEKIMKYIYGDKTKEKRMCN
jgi:hypothetical protein